jgi:glutaredoxin 3
MRAVTVYTTDPCSLCVTAKELLESRGIAYQEVNLAKDPDGRAALQERTGMATFPQIVIGSQTIGGLRELIAAEREGRLGELLGT